MCDRERLSLDRSREAECQLVCLAENPVYAKHARLDICARLPSTPDDILYILDVSVLRNDLCHCPRRRIQPTGGRFRETIIDGTGD